MAYLDALQVLLESDAVTLIGSDAPHYTASKLFPYIMAQKPLLVIVHENSSVAWIADQTRAGRVVTFNNADRPPAAVVPEIRAWLDTLLSSPADLRPVLVTSTQRKKRSLRNPLALLTSRTHAPAGLGP